MLLQRAWRRSSGLSNAQRLRAHYSSHNKKRLLDALRRQAAPAQQHAIADATEPAQSPVIHHLARNDAAAATALLLQESNGFSTSDTRSKIGLALRQALETDKSLLPSLMALTVSAHGEIPSDVFDACVAHCRDHSLSKFATSLAHAVHNDLAPLPSSPLDFVIMLVECGANRAAVTIYEKLQERQLVHALPTHVIHMLSCLQCVYDGVTPRTKPDAIQTDAASIVRYFHYDHKNMAKAVVDVMKRHGRATPPPSLVHQLAVDLKTVGEDVAPLLEYAVVDRQLVLEPHVYLSWLETASMDAAAPLLLKCLPSIFRHRIDGDDSMEIVRVATRQCLRQTRLSLGLEFFAEATKVVASSEADDAKHLVDQDLCEGDLGLRWVLTTLQAVRANALANHATDELAVVALYLHPRVSPEVATSMARFIPDFGKAPSTEWGDLLVKAGLYRKLARALCFDGHVELATGLFAWLEDSQNAAVPMDVWTLFFLKSRRPAEGVAADLDGEASRRRELIQPALDRFTNHLTSHSLTTRDDVDAAVAAAMKAALYVRDFDRAFKLQDVTSWAAKDATQDALATVLAAARGIEDPMVRRSVATYFLEKQPSAETATWPGTLTIFDVLVKNGIHIGHGAYRKMLLQAVHDLDMVAAHTMLQHAQQHSVEVSPEVFAVCFAQHARSARDPTAFVTLLNSMSTLGLVQDNGVVYQAAIRACMAANKTKLVWGCVNRAESRGVMLDSAMLGELEALL